ncbi:efflux RND transporter permease subunit [Sulfurospirillum sp. T05]|uniref:Efflux RND transporter permease subunit n=1 Tax=Sulfurospirillum tamanense TaxID=2813362 RepID=A0ABS2WNW8_9BACT|nr:CusA/CzcA family heavy metal efflux RND transporter [Sulfurospirillum tamanensis]MBN2963318.1 efflux RND transporter permease subunit [Sulfurospirillum tamanensis]
MVEHIIEGSLRNKAMVLLTLLLGVMLSVWAMKHTALDALPDLTPPQVIVSVEFPGQSPKVIEDQVVYELTSALLSVPKSSTVRAFTSFGNALVYVIFDDATDLYWARDRVSEVIASVAKTVPQEASIRLGPDATGIGWVFEYALTSNTKSLQELRTLQDYVYRYALLGVEGVSEVASVGGFVKTYEITLRQDDLVRYDLGISQVKNAIAQNNRDVGGGVLLENGFEHMVQAKGYAKSAADLLAIPLGSPKGVPLTLGDIADVTLVPSYRSGLAELNGEGEVVGGIVVVRYKENAYKVIQAVKERLESLHVNDVEVITTYDRSDLILNAITNLQNVLLEESVVVFAVVMLFLLHVRSALVVLIILPLTIALTFLLMKLFGIESNIMSLGGIAIAIGAMVDACVVMIENVHKKLGGKKGISETERVATIITSSKQVGRPIFFALLIIVVSFLPIFSLGGQEGALFKPLAYTKTFAMLIGAILAITFVPVLMVFFIKGTLHREEKNPLNRFFIAAYGVLLKFSMRFWYLSIAVFVGLLIFGYHTYTKQRWEFMPPLHEQALMYMPVTSSGISIETAKAYAKQSNAIIKSFPEVESTFAKVGRAATATDPAPLSMIETIIQFKPQSQWREGVTYASLQEEMNAKLQLPGLVNSWTFPIRGRIDMLITGMRTPLGIKLYGDNDEALEKSAQAIATALGTHQDTRSVFADKSNSGYYLDISLNPEPLAQYGMDKEAVLEVIAAAVGGAKISTFFEGIERYPITLRLELEHRSDLEALKALAIKTPYGFQPLETFATLAHTLSPGMMKTEMGKKVTYVYITLNEGTSSKTYKEEASALLANVPLPTGFYTEWAGESEYLEGAMERLKFIIPLALLLTFVLIFLGLRSLGQAVLVFLTLPFAVVGGFIYMDYLNFNLSIATIAGFLALIGIAVETAIVMIIYLNEAVATLKVRTKETLRQAVFEGAVLRVRPKLMTVLSTLLGLLPIMWAQGAGSEVMQRIAAPMIGGLVSSAILTLFIIPVVYYKLQKEDQ